MARRIGIDPEEVLRGAASPEAKQALKLATSEAVGGVSSGAPAFFVGDEIYWVDGHLVERTAVEAESVPAPRRSYP